MALKTFILKNKGSKAERREAIQNAVRKYLNDENVTIEYGEKGMPLVENWSKRLHIAISCAHEIMMVVLYEKPVGIDAEYLPTISDPKSRVDYNILAERFLSFDESEYIRDTSHGTEAENFARIWVRKEAYVKAAGKSLVDFPNFSVVDGSRLLPKLNGITIKKFAIKFPDSENYVFAIAGVD